ncbi:hypothetical protein AVEN_25947-2-1, partial [Araneus ventricosus]
NGISCFSPPCGQRLKEKKKGMLWWSILSFLDTLKDLVFNVEANIKSRCNHKKSWNICLQRNPNCK